MDYLNKPSVVHPLSSDPIIDAYKKDVDRTFGS